MGSEIKVCGNMFAILKYDTFVLIKLLRKEQKILVTANKNLLTKGPRAHSQKFLKIYKIDQKLHI